jgi:hypothetical protein
MRQQCSYQSGKVEKILECLWMEWGMEVFRRDGVGGEYMWGGGGSLVKLWVQFLG